MKKLGFVAIALALATTTAAAQYAPWCFYGTGRNSSGSANCTFYSFEQCMATARGIGGSCSPNAYSGQPPGKRHRTR